MNKICTKCKILKPLNDYHKSSRSKDHKQSRCKKCMISYSLAWGKNNKERKNKNARNSTKNTFIKRRETKLKKTFGITQFEYDALAAAQNYLCAICKQPETSKYKKDNRVKALAVDHDHTYGKLRGLLCARCNTFIGLAKENILIMERAIAYLLKHKGVNSDKE